MTVRTPILLLLALSLTACDRSAPDAASPAPETSAPTSQPAVAEPPATPAAPATPSTQPTPMTPDQKYNAANARGICQAANVWATDHTDHLPDHLAQLVAANYISPKQLLCKPFTTSPLPKDALEKAKSDPASFIQDVDAHCDWVYLGADLINQTDSSIVLLYQKPSTTTADGFILGFEDGHSELVPPNRLAKAFEYTNKLLTKAGKPPIDTTTLLHPPPANP